MKYLCQLKNGKKVWYDSINFHFATHLSDTPELLLLVEKFLTQKICTEQLIIEEYYGR